MEISVEDYGDGRSRVLAFPGEGRCQTHLGRLTDESFPCYFLDSMMLGISTENEVFYSVHYAVQPCCRADDSSVFR